MTVEKGKNGLGVAGGILAIIGAVFGFIPLMGWLFWILWTLALIFSIIGVSKKNVKKGMAWTGLIICIIMLIFRLFIYKYIFAAAVGSAAGALMSM